MTIKFRVWDSLKKRFVVEDYYKNEFISIALGFHSDCCVNRDELTLQQFTGLSDKNGKEIYEGDIIRRVFEDDLTYTYTVLYSESDTAFMLKVGNDECLMMLVPVSTFEVIGNIYENPELLIKH